MNYKDAIKYIQQHMIDETIYYTTEEPYYITSEKDDFHLILVFRNYDVNPLSPQSYNLKYQGIKVYYNNDTYKIVLPTILIQFLKTCEYNINIDNEIYQKCMKYELKPIPYQDWKDEITQHLIKYKDMIEEFCEVDKQAYKLYNNSYVK